MMTKQQDMDEIQEQNNDTTPENVNDDVPTSKNREISERPTSQPTNRLQQFEEYKTES